MALHGKRTADAWIRDLGLEPHPEGGYYTEIYRSGLTIGTCCLGPDWDGERSSCTVIYYLLAGSQVSTMHRLKGDELWLHHAGVPLKLQLISPGGRHEEVSLGADPSRGERLQALVPRGTWMGAKISDTRSFSLVSCLVTPGFEFGDFEIGERESLAKLFPEHRRVIEELTKQ